MSMQSMKVADPPPVGSGVALLVNRWQALYWEFRRLGVTKDTAAKVAFTLVYHPPGRRA